MMSHELGAVARLGELVLAKIARNGADVGQVRRARRVDGELAQIAGVDQIAGARGDDEVVIVAPESARPRGRTQTDEREIGAHLHPLENGLEREVRLIHEHEIDVGPCAPRERLYRRDLGRRIRIRPRVHPLDDAALVQAFGFECGQGLIDQAQRRDREGHALAAVEGALDDVRGRQRFSEPGRRLQHRAPMAADERSAQGF